MLAVALALLVAAPVLDAAPAPSPAALAQAQLGIDENARPFQKAGTLRRELDWTTFYEIAGRPDLVGYSERNIMLRPVALVGGVVLLIGGAALAVHGLRLGNQGKSLHGDSGTSLEFQGAATFTLGGISVPIGAVGIVAGAVIGPQMGSIDDNCQVANHNARVSSAAASPRPDSAAFATSAVPMVTDPRIAQILSAESDLQKATERLISEANDNGGVDNITVALVRYSS